MVALAIALWSTKPIGVALHLFHQLNQAIKAMTSNVQKKERRESPKTTAVAEAATEKFLTYGFFGTSMNRIAEAASVSKRTVYDHFPNKEELFQAIADKILKRIRRTRCFAW